MKIFRNIFLLVAVGIFLSCAACSQQTPPPQIQSGPTASVSIPGVAQDFVPGELEAHYRKHGAEFGAITQEQYLEGARALLNAAAVGDVREKKRSNGDTLRYRVSTSEFAVMTSTGRIRTYFKATYNYWLRQ